MNETTMHAVVADGLGGAEVLQLREVARPRPGLNEILVRVHAAGINPVDWKTRAGGGLPGLGFPAVFGYDVAGVVEEVGDGVTLFAPGDEVFGMPRFPELPGAYAQFVAAPARHFVPKPANLSFEEAAGLPLAGLTAWQGLFDTAKLQPGQRLLVHAAAGGVGHLAIQIAERHGAHVIGTASAAKHDLVRGLGADEMIDYRSTDFVEVLRDAAVDVVLDTMAEEYSLRSLEVLRDGGVLVSFHPVEEAALKEAGRRGIATGFTLVEPDRLALTELAAMAGRGELKVLIDSVFPLAEAPEAHRRGETNQASGKIVLRVA